MLRNTVISALALLSAFVAAAPAGAKAVVQPVAGMYALTSAIAAGGTCAVDAQLPPFKYFFYSGVSAAGSEFYYLSTPGSAADTVTMPTAPTTTTKHWTGHMVWTLNPFTFAPPHVTTPFDINFTFMEARLFFLNGSFTVPTSGGGTCTEMVNYTAVKTGS